MEQLDPCKAAWEKIAESLGFKEFEIAGIKADLTKVMGGPEACLREVITKWLQWAPGDARGSSDYATLEALKSAVSKAGFGKAAAKLTLFRK